jgi:cytochrome c oxidase subunit III
MNQARTLPDPLPLPVPQRRGTTQSGIFGMALFVFTEVMLFAGFISAFDIVRASAAPGTWPPPGQPRLPFERTALNTAALLLSGVALLLANRAMRAGHVPSARRWFGAAILLGAGFVLFQGAEWVALLRHGLTLTSSQLGAFFYLIVGAHALHATIALLAMAIQWRHFGTPRLSASAFGALQVFWYFVVLMWPVIYLKVYS